MCNAGSVLVGAVAARDARPCDPGFIVPGVVVELAAQGMARAFVDGMRELGELVPLEQRATLARVGEIARAAIVEAFPDGPGVDAIDMLAAFVGGVLRTPGKVRT